MVATYKPNGYTGMVGMTGAFITRGKIFYVDGITYGNDSNTGLSPQKPLETIAAALDLCTADADDYIIVLDCYQQEAAWPISVDVNRVHIVGLATPRGSYPVMVPTTDNPVFEIVNTGQYSEISGFDLGGSAAGTHGCIEINNGIAAWIHHCSFGSNLSGGAPQDGIRVTSGNSQQCLIEECTFYGTGGSTNGHLTRDGINFDVGNNFHSIIRNNFFLGLPTYAILISSNAMGVTVQDNVIACVSDTIGTAIYVAGATALSNLIVGNKAIFGGSTVGMAQNPYYDDGGANANHWVGNMKGNAFTDPV